jgi:hypothetical protein
LLPGAEADPLIVSEPVDELTAAKFIRLLDVASVGGFCAKKISVKSSAGVGNGTSGGAALSGVGVGSQHP